MVRFDGSFNRTAWFEVEDEDGLTVSLTERAPVLHLQTTPCRNNHFDIPLSILQAAGTRMITIQPVNDPPVVTGKRFEVLEDGTFQGVLEAYDPEGENITFQIGCSPEQGAVEIDSTTTFTSTAFNYTHLDGVGGLDSFAFVVSDGETEAFGQVRVFFFVIPGSHFPPLWAQTPTTHLTLIGRFLRASPQLSPRTVFQWPTISP